MASNPGSEQHGGINPAELKQFGITPADLIDFSVNSNPFGPSPGVLAAVRAVDFSTYPDPFCSALRESLAQVNQVTPGHILPGNGTAELIWLIAQSLLTPGDKVLIVGPTFGEYQRAAVQWGAKIEEIRALPPYFHPPVDQVLTSIRQSKPRLVFLCNPNNPTGAYLEPPILQQVIDACGSETLLVLDEAYQAFVQGTLFAGLPAENCLVLRSMTKEFALAGLRLGYVMGKPEIIARMRQFQPSWSVNSFVQAAGLAGIADAGYYHQTLAELKKLSQPFFNSIQAAGYAVVPSDVHFGIFAAGCPARDLRQRLMAFRCQVRDCTSFGLPTHIRVSTRTSADNQKLLEAIQAVSATF